MDRRLIAARRSLTHLTRAFEVAAAILVLCGTQACSASRSSAPAAVTRSAGNETDRLIDSLLGDMHRVEADAATNPPRVQPEKPNEQLDSFEQDRERIRSSLEKWDQGTGAALRFVKQSTGERLSLIFIDETAPGYQSETDMWMIQATARVSGGKVVGHFVLFLKDLRAGRYRGDDHSKEAVMAVLIGDARWDGENPETAWSMNAESWCDVQLQPAGKTGIEGTFRARLVDNKGSGYVQVESGYLFIKQ
jgi:hypothetical protein